LILNNILFPAAKKKKRKTWFLFFFIGLKEFFNKLAFEFFWL
jgi:hypothetical protein